MVGILFSTDVAGIANGKHDAILVSAIVDAGNVSRI